MLCPYPSRNSFARERSKFRIQIAIAANQIQLERERKRWKVGEEKGFVYSPRWLLLYYMNLPLVPVQFHSNNPPTHSFATRQQLFLLATSCSFVKFFEMWAYWGLKFQILIFSSAPAFITLIFYRPQFVILRVATIIIIMYNLYT